MLSTGPRSSAPTPPAASPDLRIIERTVDQVIELELRSGPDAKTSVRNRRIRSGLWMHWGAERFPAATILPGDEGTGALLFTCALEGTWRETYAQRTDDFLRPSGLAVIRADSLLTAQPLSAPAYHVTLAISPAALTGILAGDESAASTALRRFAAETATPELTLPLTAGAQLAAESIRRCPFAGASRALALTARCNDLLTEFFIAFAALAAPDATTTRLALRNTEAQVQAAADLLRRDLEHPPSLAELARAVGLSESTLKRGFHQLFQTTPFGYHRACRMESARRLLEQGEANVIEAAAYVGYSNPSNFAAAFRRQFGVNPKTFQLSARR